MSKKPLTQLELAKLNPEKVSVIQLVLNMEAWSNLDSNLLSGLKNPVRLQFDENIRSRLGPLGDKKGIYMFHVEPEFPFDPPITYLVYVGRVTKGNTFHKRFYDYESAIGDTAKRRNIQMLTNLWYGKTWVYFYELSVSDDQINKIEKQLVDNIIPPLNNQFYSKQAINSRSIYN